MTDPVVLNPSSIMAYRQGVIDAVKAKLPASIKVEKHDGQFDLESLDRIIAVAPCVYVAVIAAKPGGMIGTGQQFLALHTVCFVVTRDKGALDAADFGWAIAEQIASMAVMNCFTDPTLPASKIQIENLWTNEADKKRVSLAGVAWENELLVGADWSAASLELLGDVLGDPGDTGVVVNETVNGG